MAMDGNTVGLLREKARRIRIGIVEALGVGRAGHLGGSMSAAEIVAVLYFHKMHVSPAMKDDPDRDRFIMSKGHSVLAQYAALAEAGYFPGSELPKTKTLGALLQGHPETGIPGVEANTGSLGQGLSVGVGMCLGARMDRASWRVYVLLGDGELAEGQVWEAATAARHHKLDRLRAIVDANGISAMGRIAERYDTGDPDRIAGKFRVFGWEAVVVDGHSVEAVAAALDTADGVKDRPSAIVCRTIKGKGVAFAEDTNVYHNRALEADTREQALAALRK